MWVGEFTLTGSSVFCQNEANSAATLRPGAVQPAVVHAASVLNRAGIPHCTRKQTWAWARRCQRPWCAAGDELPPDTLASRRCWALHVFDLCEPVWPRWWEPLALQKLEEAVHSQQLQSQKQQFKIRNNCSVAEIRQITWRNDVKILIKKNEFKGIPAAQTSCATVLMLGKIFLLSGGFFLVVLWALFIWVFLLCQLHFLVLLQIRSQSLTGAMLPVLRQHVIGFTAAEEMRRRLLHAVVLTPSVADGAGMDSWRRR